MAFSGFSAKDFDAYVERKWSSNVFNLERLQVRQKLEELGRSISPHLLGVDGAPLGYQVSVEHPALSNQRRVDAQQLFFSRGEAARLEVDALVDQRRGVMAIIEDPSPLHTHAFLGVSVNQQAIEIALRVYSLALVDRENLERKTRDFFQREKLLEYVRSLRSDFSIGLYPNPSPAVAAETTDERLQELVASIAESNKFFAIWTSLDRSQEAVGTPELLAVVEAHLMRLLPLYNFIAWHRDNDFLEMREALKAAQARERSGGFSVHDQVRVTKGLFSGRRGTVEGLDGKGTVRVRLGKLVVKLASSELVRQ